MKEIIFKKAKPTINSWHEFLAVRRNPSVLSPRDLQSSFANAPWLSIDEFLQRMTGISSAGLSRDLAATYLYGRLFPNWLSGKGLAVYEYLRNSGVEDSANVLFDDWLRSEALSDRLSVALAPEFADLSLSKAYNVTKPGHVFFLIIPAGSSLQLNSLLSLIKGGSVDVIGRSAQFGMFVNGRTTHPVLDEGLDVYVREGNTSEEVHSDYTARILAVRRR